LELGVLNGEVFKEIASHSIKATAVDVRDIEFKLPDNAVYYQGTTDSYFKTLHTDVKFDMVFIDADHSYEQSLKDFINIEKYVVDDGFIFLHDTYPHTEEFLDPSICGDTYKTAHYIKSYMSDDFEILTLPFSPGITVVKKIKKSKQLIWV
jgi:predicted O-methyltransferase YrrM